MEKKHKITSIQIGDQEINMEEFALNSVDLDNIKDAELIEFNMHECNLPTADDLNKVFGRTTIDLGDIDPYIEEEEPEPQIFMMLEISQRDGEKPNISIRAHPSFEVDQAIAVFEECLSEMKKHKVNGFKFVNEIE